MRAAICRFGGVGDDLIAASVLPGLKERYGEVDVLTAKPAGVVFENNPHMSRLIYPDRKPIENANSLEWQKWFGYRSSEYDFFVNLSHSCETMMALTAGQTQFYWPRRFRRMWCDNNYVETVTVICGLPFTPGPLFYPTPAEMGQALEKKEHLKLDKFIGWCLSGSRIDKVYPYSAMVIARLVKEVAPVFMFGAPGKEFEMAKAIAAHVERANGSLKGLHLGLSPDPENPSWPIRRIITQLHTADCVVGPDTGPMWGVAFEPMHKVMLLSHASEENITKHWVNTTTLHADQTRVPCWPCHRLHDDPSTCVPNKDKNAAACMADINADDIVTNVANALKG